jgi:Tfp pilus assembly protein PilF
MAYAIAAIGKTGGFDRSRAIVLLQQAAAENPNDAEVLMSLAEIYRIDGKNDLARPLYERAMAVDPGQVTASVGLGGILMEQGQYVEAIRLWNEALTRNAGLELVRLNLSLALWKSGRREEAEANLKKALAINPAFAPARDLLRQIAPGDAH